MTEIYEVLGDRPVALGEVPRLVSIRRVLGSDRFDPDRWITERRIERSRGAAVPFGAGNRKCIGDATAWTEATIALATVLRRWKLRPVPGSHAPQESTASLAHPDRVPMDIQRRDV
ncbi:cytochrome P450 [Streptomyces sp.]|uniref:cytochrome P450 n=1 Tax=Streptomyces sp. TaxID=1931 RepID=UPI002D764ED9|nr:cytochrome P450 [Streptomyces sp.]HET6357963.1 cytochrome P450 [Streptomyces sp.]